VKLIRNNWKKRIKENFKEEIIQIVLGKKIIKELEYRLVKRKRLNNIL